MQLLSPTAMASPSTDSSVEVRGLCKRYGLQWALLDVGFTLPARSILLLAGHNGSGKSTLLRLLATAIRADQGSGRIAGADLRDSRHVRQRTALLSHASYLYENLTAAENLSVAANLVPFTYGPRDIAELLDRVGLAGRARDAVATFSAGMRKRLSIARLFMQRPSVLLLDEPFGSLDPSGFSLIDDLIADAQTWGASVIMASHQVERASARADFALLLNRGEIEWSGKGSELSTFVDERGYEFAEAGA